MSDDHHNSDSNNPLAHLVHIALYYLLPFSLIVMMGFIGAAFLRGGGYQAELPEAIRPDPPKPVTTKPKPKPRPDNFDEIMALGKTKYMQCAACHGPDGQGAPAGPKKMAPSLVDSEILMGKADAALAAVHKGIAKETQDYMGVMIGLGMGMNDEDIAAVLTYTRNSFGNKGDVITAEESKAIREKLADNPAPITREELLKMAK